MTTGQKVLVAAGFVGYSYLLSKSSFLMGRVRGWVDAAKLLTDCMKEYDEKEKEERPKTEYAKYAK